MGATEKKKLSEVESYKKQRLTLAIRYCRSHLPVFAISNKLEVQVSLNLVL